MKKVLAVLMLIAIVAFCGAAARSDWTSKQNAVHEIAEIARSIGLPENDPIIMRASELWWEDKAPVALEEEKPNLWNGVLPYAVTYNPSTETEAVMIAKIIYGESRGIWSQAEQACIAWTVLNRVDAGMYGSIYSAIVAPHQFAYNAYAPTADDYGRDLTALARDVLYRWSLERAGQTGVGRVLPRGYCWYAGDGAHNYFRASYSGSGTIYFGLNSPYGS